jgi:hypothetical protein
MVISPLAGEATTLLTVGASVSIVSVPAGFLTAPEASRYCRRRPGSSRRSGWDRWPSGGALQINGAAWAHSDGEGFNLRLEYLPLNDAEIVVRTRKTDLAETAADEFARRRRACAQGRAWQPRGVRRQDHAHRDQCSDWRGDRPRHPLHRAYAVFNVEQIEGLPAHYYGKPEPRSEILPRIERAEAFFAATGAIVRHAGNRAC